MPAAWNGARAKVQLKLAVQRTKMLQEKMEAMQKQARREIATLVEKSKIETARVKTEGLINTDIHIELVELMELYSEMLLARFALLELATAEPDPSILEPLAAIIHAAPRTELRELHVLRDLLMQRYGRDFAAAVMDGAHVNARTKAKLRVDTPGKELVDAYIYEICKTYNVPFTSEYLPQAEPADAASAADEKAGGTGDGDGTAPTGGGGGQGGEKGAKAGGEKAGASAQAPAPSSAPLSAAAEKSAADSLEARFAALKRK